MSITIAGYGEFETMSKPFQEMAKPTIRNTVRYDTSGSSLPGRSLIFTRPCKPSSR